MWRKIRLYRGKDHVSVLKKRNWIELFEKHGFQFISDFQDIITLDPPIYQIGRQWAYLPLIGFFIRNIISKLVRGSFLFQTPAKSVIENDKKASIIFVCPSCHHSLILMNNYSQCSGCMKKYDRSKGYHNFKKDI